MAFFALAPSMISRYAYQSAINDRVDNLWRIHQNRNKNGLGPTKTKSGFYSEDEHTGDRGFVINNGVHLSFDSIISGLSMSANLNNPFTRYHKSIEDYPEELDNMDDAKMYTYDNYERLKPLMPKEESVVGTTTLIPTADTDEKLIFYDTQGESLYTNPPNPNAPLIDHGLDEDLIWAFRKTNYNQQVVYNPYTRDIFSALKESRAPWWGIKLASPAFFKQEKYSKFLLQWAIRTEFESLKLRHAKELQSGDMAQRDRMKSEIAAFVQNARQRMVEYEMRDVYVTDHKAKPAQYSTLNEDEDLEYYNYVKSLEDYNRQQAKPQRVSRFESGRYERGSLKQRIFEPLADATVLENGTVFLELTDKDIARDLDESALRAEYDRIKNLEAQEGEDEAEIRANMFDAIEKAGFDTEEWDKILAREFDTF